MRKVKYRLAWRVSSFSLQPHSFISFISCTSCTSVTTLFHYEVNLYPAGLVSFISSCAAVGVVGKPVGFAAGTTGVARQLLNIQKISPS
jgi:hypothetical protein